MKRSLSSAVIAAFAMLSAAAPAVAGAPPPRPIDRASPTTGPDGAPLSAEDLKELKQLEEAVGAFESASKEYRGTVTHVIRTEYEKKRRETIARYDEQIKKIEGDEKLHRL